MKDDLKTYKFNFKATLLQFNLNAPSITCPLTATWKRSSQTVSTMPTDMKGGKACFNQTISLPLNMYYQPAKQVFQDKKTLFTFTMVTPKGQKQAGVVYVEVAQMLNKKMQKLQGTYTLEKCPVKDSKVTISIEAQLIGQGSTSDTMSVDSILFNNDMPSTLSTMSIQSRQEIDTSKRSSSKSPMKKEQDKVKSGEQSKRVAELQKKVAELTKQKQKLLKQLQKSRNRDDNKQLSQHRQQLVKSKNIQEKLQIQITNLRGENIQHQRQLQKMRIRMQQIYELLLGNLNSLY